MKRVFVACVAMLLAVAVIPIASAQDEGDLVTLRVGVTQDWDGLNPAVNFSVPSYDVWNLQYATLTDKAAADFETIPGSCRVVGGIRRRADLHLQIARRLGLVGW